MCFAYNRNVVCFCIIKVWFVAEQWKLLGQEKDGSLLVGWTEETVENDVFRSYTVVGHYDRINDRLQVFLNYRIIYFYPEDSWSYTDHYYDTGIAPILRSIKYRTSNNKSKSHCFRVRNKAEGLRRLQCRDRGWNWSEYSDRGRSVRSVCSWVERRRSKGT